jgi:transcription antitermination factor NusA-like protein
VHGLLPRVLAGHITESEVVSSAVDQIADFIAAALRDEQRIDVPVKTSVMVIVEMHALEAVVGGGGRLVRALREHVQQTRVLPRAQRLSLY